MNKWFRIFLWGLGFALLIASVVFWNGQSGKNISQQQELRQIQLPGNDQKQAEENDQQLKQIPEDQLVWYGIPELGIKFKVTPDAKEDLKYYCKTIKLDSGGTRLIAYLYLQSLCDFLGEKRGKNYCKSNNYFPSEFDISRLPNGSCEKSTDPDRCVVVLHNEKYEFDISGNQQDPIFNNDEELELYADMLQEQGKNLGFFHHYSFGSRIEGEYRSLWHLEFINKK